MNFGLAVILEERQLGILMISAIKAIAIWASLLSCTIAPSSFAKQQAIKNIPGNGTPSFHFTGPGEEYNGPSDGVTRLVTGVCQGKRLSLRWSVLPRREPGTQRLIWIEELTLDDKNLDTSDLVKFEKLFIPLLPYGFDLGCQWSERSGYDFIIHFQSPVYYEFAEYWACTLGGPLPHLSRFTWYFYVSKEKGVFNPYVWPSGRLGDNMPGLRGAALKEPKPEDFPDCAAYEETGFPLTLE